MIFYFAGKSNMHFSERLGSSGKDCATLMHRATFGLSDSWMPLMLYTISQLKASYQLDLHNYGDEGSLLAWTV